jgi:hypothetical protein
MISNILNFKRSASKIVVGITLGFQWEYLENNTLWCRIRLPNENWGDWYLLEEF